MKQWTKEIRYQLEYIGLRLLAGLIPRLSRGMCVRLARGLGSVAWRVDARGRSVALANLEAAFGNRFTPAERIGIGRRSYQNFLRTMLDLFWAPRLNRGNFARHIRFDPAGAPPPVRTAGDGGLLVFSSHFGNFEWGHLGLSFSGWEGLLVSETFKNPRLSGVFDRLRSQAGSTPVPQQFSMVRMLKNTHRGGVSGLLVDLTIPMSQPGEIIEAFGMKMRVSMLHGLIAQRTGAPVMPYLAYPQEDGSTVIRLFPPLRFSREDSVAEIAQRCWDTFEPFIAERPELWMWAYKHWRFRPREGGVGYPFYANTSTPFEKALVQSAR